MSERTSDALIVRELFNDADPWERDQLEADPAGWLDQLTDLIEDLQDQFARANTELERFRDECKRQGPDGIERFRAEQARVDDWRGRTRPILREAKKRKRQVKRQVAEHNREQAFSRDRHVLGLFLKAIDQHRDELGEDAEDIDRNLYDLVDRLRAGAFDRAGADHA